MTTLSGMPGRSNFCQLATTREQTRVVRSTPSTDQIFRDTPVQRAYCRKAECKRRAGSPWRFPQVGRVDRYSWVPVADALLGVV